ncbi:MAG: NAD-dependent epimerase/dehydratase family protein [Leptospiraceae bacterium]|nr:NAD-dependent epimerase/dehydratase family protein [Leptospiraceae bacterium]
MKIFITGASGFVGGAITRQLATTHDIIALSRSEHSDAKTKALGAKPVRGDLQNIPTDALQGADVVIHNAAFVGPWGSRADFELGNIEGTRNMLTAARQAGVRRFIHMSTEAVLFAGQDMINIDESYPYPAARPYLYGATKRAAEELVLAASQDGLECIILRPRLVWGPGDTSVLPVVKQMVADGKFMWLSGGQCRTNMTCIPNLVHAVELALTRGKNGAIYFITDDEVWTFRDFLTAMLATQNIDMPDKSIPAWIARAAARLSEGTWRLLGLKSEPPLMRFATDIMTRECTIRIDKARNELGYQPVISVRAGLDAMRS